MAPGLRRGKRFPWDQADTDTVEDMDTGVEGDSESIADEKPDKTSGKRKEKTSPQLEGEQAKKKKDSGLSPSYKEILEGHSNKKPTDWIEVQSKKEKRRQHR
ncbi:hypothetical protein EVAR_40346_1 [Eumeta japonica]|uniref:Uncharacterized protein n=1 Tax=Eumeta variegata TaxID=151549 RepID=A0A4C1YET7_EUMVA|nr:hypothetical protein EVAR_40346_1 [Eumeta japonica]